MKNKAMQARLGSEVLDFIHSRKSLQLASLGTDGAPYASYAPFAIGENCLYVLLSELAIHGVNLQLNPRVSVLVIEDEDSADNLGSRGRRKYAMEARLLAARQRAGDQRRSDRRRTGGLCRRFQEGD